MTQKDGAFVACVLITRLITISVTLFSLKTRIQEAVLVFNSSYLWNENAGYF